MGKHYGLDIPTLRELRIDVDKEWVDENGQPRGIFNIKEVAEAMAHGDITFRSGSLPILVKLAVNYGIGYNVVHAKSLGGLYEPEWADIQEWIAYITGGLNRMIAPPTLAIPVPNLSLAVVEDHSGGGHVGKKTLDIPAPSIGIAIAEDHSGGGFTSSKTLDIPAPAMTSEAALIYEKLRTGDDSQLSVYGVNWEAQTFTPGTDHTVNRIGLKVRRHGSPGTLTVSIRATTGGLPNGADLTSGTFDLSVLIKEDTDYWIWIPVTSYALTGTTRYAIVVRAIAGDVDNYCQWRCDQTSPPYTDGARCYSSNSGGAWTEDTGKDFMFEEGVA